VRLLGCGFSRTRFSQTHARSSAVFFDELDAGRFQCRLNNRERGTPRLLIFAFKLSNSHDADTGKVSQLLLAPIE
jgi:hypothetical protein